MCEREREVKEGRGEIRRDLTKGEERDVKGQMYSIGLGCCVEEGNSSVQVALFSRPPPDVCLSPS